MEWIKYIVAILSGLAASIPLVVKLVEYINIAIKEKNWNELVKLTMGYMATAEKKFSDGTTRKDWVMSMVKTTAVTVNYDLDEVAITKISDMIDSICNVSKIINVIPESSVDSECASETVKAGT